MRETHKSYLNISLQFIPNHDASPSFDAQQLAGLQKDVLVWFLPGQVPRHQHTVEVLPQVEPLDLLPLGSRGPVRDQSQQVILPVSHSATPFNAGGSTC